MGSHLQSMDSFHSVCFLQLPQLTVHGELKTTDIMPKGYAITLTNPIVDGLFSLWRPLSTMEDLLLRRMLLGFLLTSITALPPS